MAAVNSTVTVIPTTAKLNNSAFATPDCRRFLRFSSPSLRRSKFTPLTASNNSSEAAPSEPSAAANVIDSAKAFAEATKSAVIEEGDKVRDTVIKAGDETKTNVIKEGDKAEDNVFGAVGDILEATKTGVVEAQGSLPEDKKE
ncbi:uncharacterized protein LOC141644111 [Silene latifolia]|uniref:uncharacterized protein LOC141644111 n=1 Tax=Silene latifolia TaxID=37657 RepID=UPI003D786D40